MRILKLTLKKKWYDMIESGEKTDEYREYKDYWKKRLVEPNTHPPIYKQFDAIEFKNGYSKNSRTMLVKCNTLLATWGKPEWGGDPNNIQFVFKLGNKL